MANIIVRNYEHYNRAMDKYIGSKRQYEYEMVKGGYMPFDKAEQLAELAREKQKQNYKKLSDKAMTFLRETKNMADKKGNIKPGNRFVDGLKKVGVKIDCQWDKLPKKYQEGGFSNE